MKDRLWFYIPAMASSLLAFIILKAEMSPLPAGYALCIHCATELVKLAK